MQTILQILERAGGYGPTLDSEPIQEPLSRQSTESITDQAHDLVEAHGFSRLPSCYGWQTFRKDLPSTFLVQASKASRLQMNFNLPSLPWQVSHSPGLAAVIRHSTFQTGRTARRVLGAHPKNKAVCRFLNSFQD